MRIAPFAVVVLLLAARAAPAEADADVVVRKWLVLAPVDVVARRTLRPDAVFAKHLLDRTSAAPKEGEEITGTLGKPAKWTTKDADKDGDVAAENGAWAYASVESPAERVVLAKLEGAATLFVNGAGFTGDVYRLGDVGVPVALRKGANEVYVAGPRGGFRLTLTKPPEIVLDPRPTPPKTTSIVYDRSRTVLPDVVEGTESDLPQAMRFHNATNAPMPNGSKTDVVPLGLGTWDPRDDWHLKIALATVKPDAPRRRTFVSSIDGSVQSYALVPPAPSDIDKSKIGLVLSLHGAGVECMDQAKAYAPKPDFWIVCPTNRGRYGFDWQDWGRLDAYEVLDDALKVTGVDPSRVYLTGHSMGGHGTWHLAANDPGRFLAIAPSAGWSSFDSYGAPKVTSPLGWMWRAADGASRTLDLVDNLAQVPTYVLHGEEDDNVPLAEAQLMVDAITRAGGKPEFHVEPGMGHWWDKDEKTPGADCVDWPGIWELFRKTEPQEGHPRRETTLVIADPSMAPKSGWLMLEQPSEYGRPSRFRFCFEQEPFVVSTENVREFELGLATPMGVTRIDGTEFELLAAWRRVGGRWIAAEQPPFGNGPQKPWPGTIGKRPENSGPFKQAFTNRFLLVYGTAGTDAEDAELLEKARYDSEVWAYRANGDANLMSDAQFLAGDFKDRNVIVYGNADTNSAWTAVFDDDCPIQAKRGRMTVNGTKHDGVVAAAFVRPRKGQSRALAAAFADTGAAATRLFYQFPVFSSGVGIPDYVVFGPGFLHEFDGDVRAAGWFDYAWRMR